MLEEAGGGGAGGSVILHFSQGLEVFVIVIVAIVVFDSPIVERNVEVSHVLPFPFEDSL